MIGYVGKVANMLEVIEFVDTDNMIGCWVERNYMQFSIKRRFASGILDISMT